MATYTSGSITFSGLSGVDVDFDDLIDKLYQIESIQANKLLEWYSDWEIRLDAFSQVRDSLVSMQTALSSINSTDKFLVKTATSSNDSIVGATTSSEAVAGSYSVEVNQLATSSVWSTGTGLADKDALVNDSGSTGTFTYVYKGESRTISVPNGTTLEQLKNLINNDGENLGVRVQLIQSGDEVVFQLSGLDTGAAATLEISNTSGLNGLGMGTQDNLWNYNSSFDDLTSTITYASTTEAINTSEGSRSFMFDVNGTNYTVKLAKGGSLDDLVNAVNAIQGETGVTASAHANGDGTYSLRLAGASGDLITVGGGSLEGYSTMLTTSAWQTQAGQNAQIRVQGWPSTGWLEVDSNTVTGVVDGVTFNLRSEGKATVTVELDTDAIQTNVQTFVDAVNQFRSLIKTLTKVEEDTAIDPDYAENQSEMQNGSALTGNYGIQLISSNLKQSVANSAKGFSYLEEIEGKVYGDLFTSLAQIGIITDTDESSDTFGLLVINTSSTSGGTTYVQSTSTMTLAEALAKDATAVAKLFAADGEAKSNSSSFGVNSTVKTVTKPGNYDVAYSTDASGNIISATINGQPAAIDMVNRQIALYDNGNDAGGTVLDIYDLTPNSTMEGSFSVRQGKVNELLGMLEGTSGILGSEGTLSILENNYKEIMANIKDKIQKEDERLQKWERLTRLRFSRLETTLANYQNLQASIESQIAQLSSD